MAVSCPTPPQTPHTGEAYIGDACVGVCRREANHAIWACRLKQQGCAPILQSNMTTKLKGKSLSTATQ
jgi:hypothetical protein